MRKSNPWNTRNLGAEAHGLALGASLGLGMGARKASLWRSTRPSMNGSRSNQRARLPTFAACRTKTKSAGPSRLHRNLRAHPSFAHACNQN